MFRVNTVRFVFVGKLISNNVLMDHFLELSKLILRSRVTTKPEALTLLPYNTSSDRISPRIETII